MSMFRVQVDTMKTVKALDFFPAVALGSIFGRSYFRCSGEAMTLPAGAEVQTIAEVQPKRWLVKAAGAVAFRFVGIDETANN